MSRWVLSACLALLVCSAATVARGADAELETLGAKSRKQLIQAVVEAGHREDVAALPVLRALRERRLRVDETGRLYAVPPEGGAALSLTRGAGEPAGERSLRKPRLNNRVRRTLLPVIALLELHADDPGVRLAAAQQLGKHPREALLAPIERAHARETDPETKQTLDLILAQLQLQSDDPAVRLAAVEHIAESGRLSFQPLLERLVAQGDDGSFAEPDPAVRSAAQAALDSLARKQWLVDAAKHLFYGVSLGSVLLLAALGLAITFGLMGVINMAHGEMLMLGAYATYSVQLLFQSYVPESIDYYLVAAVPLAFGVTALVGMALERSVIRFLYGRPLETLLATWGISLVLIQTVRLTFGAQNVSVANPAWLAGGFEVLDGVVFPTSRIVIIGFAAAVVVFVWLIIQRTRLGLEVRAVTQNRAMAASLGISTDRVDTLTFGLGSGIAGLGGVALSQLGNVGPELGQAYIVDSFMVVVLGGVGKLAGTVAGALGLGVINKFLEPVSGAVLGKIGVLVFLILFIQRRPEGIFALRGRAAE